MREFLIAITVIAVFAVGYFVFLEDVIFTPEKGEPIESPPPPAGEFPPPEPIPPASPPAIKPPSPLSVISYPVWGTENNPQYADDLQKILDSVKSQLTAKLTITFKPTLRGAFLRVRAPLKIYSNTILEGDLTKPFGGQYGITIRGENSTGLAFRREPVFIVDGSENFRAKNVKISNMEIQGNLAYAPIEIFNAGTSMSDGVNVELIRIVGSRGGGVNSWHSNGVKVKNLSMEIVRRNPADPENSEGGAAVWFLQSNYSSITDSVISARGFYDAGPSKDSGNPRLCGESRITDCSNPESVAKTLDLIAIYGGHDNTVAGNKISYGNTAGIYLAVCEVGLCKKDNRRPTRITILDNEIQYMREYGIDLANSDNLQVFSNRVYFTDDSSIGLGDVQNSVIQYNVFEKSGQYPYGGIPGVGPTGTVNFLWGSSGNQLKNNLIDGSGNDYVLTFRDISNGTGLPKNNTVDATNDYSAGKRGLWYYDPGISADDNNVVW